MFGLLVGATGLFGLVHVLRHSHHHGRCHHDAAARDQRGSRFRGYGRRRFWRWLFEELETTPGQEKSIREAVDELFAAGGELKSELRSSRAAVAQAISADVFDAQVLDDLYQRHDSALQSFRERVKSVVGLVHETLDASQRERLAS